jgi:hypothetical protein
MTENDRTNAHSPQWSRRGWGLRGVVVSALFSTVFLNIITYRTENRHRTIPRDFRPTQPRFSTLATIRIS